MPEFSQLSLLQNDMSQAEYQRLKKEIEAQSLLVANLSKASYAGQKLRTFQIPKRYNQTVPCVHLLGYLNEDGTGQTGIEKSYNTVLEQHSGSISVSYQVNGITYIVTPRYLDEGEQNVKTRFERIIKNNLTHLTDDADGDTIKAEYVSAADPIEKSSDRKEKNAGKNDSETN